MGVLYILLLLVICNLAVAGLLAQDFPAARTQYPTYVPSAPAGSKRSFHGSSLEKKELICCADRNKKCVACFVLCNWLWRVCGVCLAAT